ncbi:MAG: transcription antitermination factor NusB [bacterium]|nr:transcription antitermination factor NusB [bacterium]
MGSRRKGREISLQILYELEVAAFSTIDKNDPREITDALRKLSKGRVNQTIEAFFKNFESSDGIFDFASSLVHGTLLNLSRIDDLIIKHSTKWRLERMAKVDRNVLRFATYEIIFSLDLPTSVIIDEAIEVSKRFGSEKSAAFINGVLDSIASDSRN